MQITITLNTDNREDLAGLAALVAAVEGPFVEVAGIKYSQKTLDTPIKDVIEKVGKPIEDYRNLIDADTEDAHDVNEQIVPSDTIDSDGLPWDERIHSSNHGKNADGTWRKRRGVDEVMYGKIHAELSEAAGRPNGEPTGTSLTGPGQPDGNSVTEQTAAVDPNAQLRSAPPPPTVEETARTAPPPPPADDAPVATGGFSGFPDFVQKVNVFGHPYVKLNEIAGNVGIAGGFKDMKDHPHLWDMFYDMAQG